MTNKQLSRADGWEACKSEMKAGRDPIASKCTDATCTFTEAMNAAKEGGSLPSPGPAPAPGGFQLPELPALPSFFEAPAPSAPEPEPAEESPAAPAFKFPWEVEATELTAVGHAIPAAIILSFYLVPLAYGVATGRIDLSALS